jgi:hypothetical protein
MIKLTNNYNFKDNEVNIDTVKITYSQNPDNCSGENDFQELTLETRDGGGGKYINIHTNENGWSIDNEDDLLQIIKHFKSSYENIDNP